jgi:hypothetical protein
MTQIIEGLIIKGGAGPQEAAAIVAAIAHAESEAEDAKARRPTPLRPSSWVQSGRPRESVAPLPSHVYDAQPWSPATQLPED